MLQSVRNAWKITELRQRILFTLGMFLVFRMGANITVPGLDPRAVEELFTGGVFGFADIISGGALAQLSIFALNIAPYITASIIIQLLTAIIPKWEAMMKEGEEGRKKMQQYVRYGTVVLAFIQGLATAYGLRGTGAVADARFYSLFLIALNFTAGTVFLMWLGELITDKGIGNGISLIIFANIVSRFPLGVATMLRYLQAGTINIFAVVLLGILALVVIAGVVWVTEGQRRIPVQYAKRVVGRRMYGGHSTHIPLRVNQAGVIPVIFASSLLLFPQMLAQFIAHPIAQTIAGWFRFGTPLHITLYVTFIIAFAYFYTFLQFNPKDIADNLKKSGGFIPGIRPGRPTTEHLLRVVNRLILVGALFLSIIVLLPLILSNLVNIEIGLGGPALLIVVGVALETMKQIESHMVSRHYGGFMR